MTGRNRGSVALGDLPDDVQPGDYWRYLSREHGEPLRAEEASNLTGGVWGVSDPLNGHIGRLVFHTVREHDDGTASIRPNDGSSNSVKISGYRGMFHGYLEHGVWETLQDSYTTSAPAGPE